MRSWDPGRVAEAAPEEAREAPGAAEKTQAAFSTASDAAPGASSRPHQRHDFLGELDDALGDLLHVRGGHGVHPLGEVQEVLRAHPVGAVHRDEGRAGGIALQADLVRAHQVLAGPYQLIIGDRSEERRVGEAWVLRWAA